MQLAVQTDATVNYRERPRPFGRGRLCDWRLEQDVVLAADCGPDGEATGVNLAEGSLDPVVVWAPDGSLEMTFGPIARFVVDLPRRTVRLVAAHPDADQATIDHLLDDQIAPRIIAADGTLVLHGSATLIGGHIAVFLGLTGSGKSTLAASLHVCGHALLGDDAVVIAQHDGAITGEAVYPSLRLYRESVEEVLQGDLQTSAMAFYSDKRHVSIPGFGASDAGRFALGGIYVLANGEEGVALDRFSPSEGCMALLENSFALDPTDGAMAARRLAMAARVATAVPCYELAYPYDFSLLGEVRARVIASLSHLATPV
jgi:hypothetical protein